MVTPEIDLSVDLSDDERTVCFCHAVPFGELKKAIAEGSNTLSKVKSDTCASTGCGGCEEEVIQILEVLAPAKISE